MAFCKNCGEQLADGVKFCGNCGARVEDTAQGSSQRKSAFDGELHKCPNCGEILKAFESVCPACGYELRGTGASKSVKDLNDRLERAKTESQKISVILTYPIPNTKEDIYELFLLAYSNLDTNLYAQKLDYEDITDAWYSLIKRCYEKAKVSFGNHTEFVYIEKKYLQVNSMIEKDLNKLHKKQKLNKNKGFIVLVACVLVLIVAITAISVQDMQKITIGKSAADFGVADGFLGSGATIYMSYADARKYLEDLGFTNFAEPTEYNQKFGDGLANVPDGSVYKISIDGIDDFDSTDKFYSNALITIVIFRHNNQ